MMARKKTSPHDAASKALAGHNGFSLISDQQLRDFYKGLLQCRALENHLCGARRLTPWSWASAVACCADLRRQDALVAPLDAPIYPLLKKVSLQLLAAGDAPRERACRARNLCAVDAARPEDLLRQAHLLAQQKQEKGNGDLVVVFAPASMAKARVVKAIALAIEEKLPILYVFASRPRGNQNLPEAKDLPDLPSFPWIPIDGEDAVAAYRAASESIARIRRGNGPALIDCIPFQAPDVLTGPIAKMEAYLTRKHLYQPALTHRIEKAFHARLQAIG
jgi:hypothetical protein